MSDPLLTPRCHNCWLQAGEFDRCHPVIVAGENHLTVTESTGNPGRTLCGRPFRRTRARIDL